MQDKSSYLCNLPIRSVSSALESIIQILPPIYWKLRHVYIVRYRHFSARILSTLKSKCDQLKFDSSKKLADRTIAELSVQGEETGREKSLPKARKKASLMFLAMYIELEITAA